MENQVHILNGDSLNQQFPDSVTGERIIFRECLVEGNVSFKTNFYEGRAKEIHKIHTEISEKDYLENTVPELKKIDKIPKDHVINLWFEEDLFCQVNMWYVIHQIYPTKSKVYLIKPIGSLEFGFGGMVESDLVVAFTDKIRLESRDLKKFSRLWEAFKKMDVKKMSSIGRTFKDRLSFVADVIDAYTESVPFNGNPGRPKQAIIDIMEELDTRDFGPIFREFSKRESIYGFGDLQVKKLFDEVIHKD